MKKVLASVLAGTMVLGMATAASAAPELVRKAPTGTDREYDLYLYEPAGVNVVEEGELRYNLNTSTLAAFEDYEDEYAAFMRASDNGTDAITEYFVSRTKANRPTIADAYAKLFAATGTDTVYTSVAGLQADIKTDLAKFVTGTVDSAKYGLTQCKTDGVATIEAAGGDWAPTALVALSQAVESVRPALILGVLDDIAGVQVNQEVGTGTRSGSYMFQHKDAFDMTDDDAPFVTHMYTYGEDNAKEVRVNVWVAHGDDLRADVNEGKVSVSKKLVEKNWVDRNDTRTDADVYMLTIKAKADVRDFELDDFQIELDVGNDGHDVFFIEGDVAYSDYREVRPGDRHTINKSDRTDNHNDGSIFKFDEPIDEKVRIIANEYVDLYFDGNYGTDFENLKVETDDITEVEDFFQDYDIDYYDFIGTPKFARDVKCIIDADSDSYIYEYDKKTGDVVDITDECEYTSNGWEFKRKSFKTYVILEEPYEGGNVKAEKEPVAEEPEDEPDDTEEPKDDPSSEGSKPNPGTGAYPLF